MRTLVFAAMMTMTLLTPNGWSAETEALDWKAPNGIDIPYRLAVPPKIEEGKVYPLVLFLHGAGERGNDNSKQLKHGVVPILKAAEKLGDPCFLIAPQCPENLWWAPLDEQRLHLSAAKEPNPRLEAVLALVADFIAKNPVDKKRFYVTGISMGGFGTWDILGRVPEKIAAAVPICGGGDASLVSRYKDVPIFAFHGAKDSAVPLAATTDRIHALETAGAKPKLTVYPEEGHESWIPAYDDIETVKWMFAQRLGKR